MQYYVSKEIVHDILQKKGMTAADFLEKNAPLPEELCDLIEQGGPTWDAVLIGELEKLLQISSSRFVLLKKERFDGIPDRESHDDTPLDYDISHFERDTRDNLYQRAATFQSPENLTMEEQEDAEEELHLRRLSMEVAVQQYHRDPSRVDEKTAATLKAWEKNFEEEDCK